MSPCHCKSIISDGDLVAGAAVRAAHNSLLPLSCSPLSLHGRFIRRRKADETCSKTLTDLVRYSQRPALASRPSHAGYLTLTSPLIASDSIEPLPTSVSGRKDAVEPIESFPNETEDIGQVVSSAPSAAQTQTSDKNVPVLVLEGELIQPNFCATQLLTIEQTLHQR